MGKRLQALCSGVAKFADWASIVLLLFITFQLTVVVILRYFFFTNIRWFEQSSVILFFYLVFIPAGLLSRTGQHLNVEILWEHLQKHEKKKALWLLYLAQRAVEIIFCAVALYFSWTYTCHLIAVEATFDFEFFGRRVPQWSTAAAFVLGFFLLGLHTLEAFVSSILKKKV
jgi:TRAP-type C4-dicarboxylate transport system permease small subunit